jgi:hypothetical protein
MLVISPIEFEKTPKKYCEMAEKDSVFVKYANNYIKLSFTKRLPRKSKKNNNPSPSGDTWFDDPRNLAAIEEGLQDIKSGRSTTLKTKKELHNFLDSL